MSRTTAVALAALMSVGLVASTATSASAAAPKKYQNCTQLNKAYKHGVGKKGARDKVSGRNKPVRNFRVDNALYLKNKHLDRDKDGIACEKR